LTLIKKKQPQLVSHVKAEQSDWKVSKARECNKSEENEIKHLGPSVKTLVLSLKQQTKWTRL